METEGSFGASPFTTGNSRWPALFAELPTPRTDGARAALAWPQQPIRPRPIEDSRRVQSEVGKVRIALCIKPARGNGTAGESNLCRSKHQTVTDGNSRGDHSSSTFTFRLRAKGNIDQQNMPDNGTRHRSPERGPAFQLEPSTRSNKRKTPLTLSTISITDRFTGCPAGTRFSLRYLMLTLTLPDSLIATAFPPARRPSSRRS